MKVCRHCKYLIDPDEDHFCPSPEYEKQKQSLINNALAALDYFTEDELEYDAHKISTPTDSTHS